MKDYLEKTVLILLLIDLFQKASCNVFKCPDIIFINIPLVKIPLSERSTSILDISVLFYSLLILKI